MNRTVKDYQERRAEILAAARELFFSLGYEATSVQDIIDKVGIAKGTFYHYFHSKIDLLDALIAAMAQQQLNKAQSIVDESRLDAAQKMERIFNELEALKTDQRHFFLDILPALFSDDNIIVRYKMAEQARSAVRELITQVIRQGVAEGIFTTSYPERIGDIIMVVLQNTSNELAALILDDRVEETRLSRMEELLAVNQHAVNLLLGAQPGTIQVYNEDRMKLWFENE